MVLVNLSRLFSGRVLILFLCCVVEVIINGYDFFDLSVLSPPNYAILRNVHELCNWEHLRVIVNFDNCSVLAANARIVTLVKT